MADLSLALIGYGLAGSAFHAPLIEATAGLELAAIVTRDPGRRADAQRRHPRAALLDSADELWARRDALDVVVVASPNRTHVPLALAALDAGLAVVVDKPVAPDLQSALVLAARARDRGRPVIPFHNRRWDGDLLTLRSLIDAGELGEVTRLESRFERFRPQPAEGWRELDDPAEAGGVLYDLGPHLVDQALLLFGPPATVYAELDARRPGAAVDDDAFVAITHASGVRSHLWMSAAAPHLGPRLRVLGTRAAYVKHGLDVQEAALRAGEAAGGEGWGAEPPERWGSVIAGDDERAVETIPGAYQRFYEGVAATLRDGGPPPVELADAIRAAQVLDAARASDADRRVVTLA